MTSERQGELFPTEGNSPSTEPTEEVLINDRTSAETTTETTTEAQVETQSSTTTEETQAVGTTENTETKSVDEQPKPAWTGLTAQQEREAKETQQKLNYYEEQQRQHTIQNEAGVYKKQLEDQGYMPEQAQQISDMRIQQANRDHDMQSQYKTQLDHMRGKFAAVTQFSKDYGIPPDDLMRFEDPQSMEAFAKKEKKIKDLENELAGYKDKQVPPQSYDNSQAEPSASTSEDRLLDLYNQGVRNSDTEAAARRATGL